ncbi:hypothetical protein GIB67_023665 [Kingdonia uniflora]|uniref:MTTase N-terminal domain-containing protein n=1 Tax=Kingdonia uniflora TaxID=39325 RepID=A0A7J7MGN7_9MAGN|nr:hypothetical protein GIB67_023665 [Kingdonia uniflora]
MMKLCSSAYLFLAIKYCGTAVTILVEMYWKCGGELKNKKNLKRDDYLITTSSSDIPRTQPIYMKIFECSHNQSDGEYMASQLSAFGYTLSSRVLNELEGVSVDGVQQIDCVVEAIEETLKGYKVYLLNRKTLPILDLTKVRKNNFIEILLMINIGCLGVCTYCKTKHARGHLGSYTIESLVEHAGNVVADGVKDIWINSEDIEHMVVILG